MVLSIKAPAKINWFLSVLGRRDDGYHEIRSVMQRISLYDTLVLEPSEEIELISDMDVPVGQNLAYRAAVLLKEHAGFRGGAVIRLAKEIPSAAGLGGGSSDAASVLEGLDRLWGLNLPLSELRRLAAKLGSDVPFFIGERNAALSEGRGEVLSDLPAASLTLLLVKPDVAVSTAWAYGVRGPVLTKKFIDIKLFCQALDSRDFASLRNMLHNDLEPGVVRKFPVVADIKAGLERRGAVIAAMSGSGPSVFGVYQGREEAVAAAAHVRGHWCRVVDTLSAGRPDAGQGEES